MGTATTMKPTKRNGSILRWMVAFLAALIIGKAVWDTMIVDPLDRTTRSSTSTTGNTRNSKQKKKKNSKYLYEDEPNVIEVTSDSGFFQTSSKPRIVEFYSPYCGHCRNFKQTYVKVANEAYEKYGDAVEFYGVSCLSFHEICSKFEANSYPTVIGMLPGSNEATKIGQMFFNLEKVEEGLKLGDGSAKSSTR